MIPDKVSTRYRSRERSRAENPRTFGKERVLRFHVLYYLTFLQKVIFLFKVCGYTVRLNLNLGAQTAAKTFQASTVCSRTTSLPLSPVMEATAMVLEAKRLHPDGDVFPSTAIHFSLARLAVGQHYCSASIASVRMEELGRSAKSFISISRRNKRQPRLERGAHPLMPLRP